MKSMTVLEAVEKLKSLLPITAYFCVDISVTRTGPCVEENIEFGVAVKLVGFKMILLRDSNLTSAVDRVMEKIVNSASNPLEEISEQINKLQISIS